MILLSNTTAQTIAPGQALSFDKVIYRSRNCCECFNAQAPASVKLCSQGVYEVSFSGNITNPTGTEPVQLAIGIGGQPLSETYMNSVPVAAGDLNSVAKTTFVKNCCCDLDRLSIINTGAVPVAVAPNTAFAIHKL